MEVGGLAQALPAINSDLPFLRPVNHTTVSFKSVFVFTVCKVIFPSAILDVMSALPGSRT